MDTLLFSDRSLWTMFHGMVLGGGGMIALAAALFALRVIRADPRLDPAGERRAREVGWLLVLAAVLLWASVIVGTYVVFPPYRATPPEGLVNLAQYPRSLIQANPETAWLHGFAMETKEHAPWIAAMLATAVAFVGVRHRSRLLVDRGLKRMVMALLAIALVLVAYVATLGVFVNKVAPLE
jgi:heme A synthase